MEWITDKTVNVVMDTCAIVFALTVFCILVALTLDAIDDAMDRITRPFRSKGDRL